MRQRGKNCPVIGRNGLIKDPAFDRFPAARRASQDEIDLAGRFVRGNSRERFRSCVRPLFKKLREHRGIRCGIEISGNQE